MTKRQHPMSVPVDPRRAAAGAPADRRVASAPVEHVRARCPALIATLVAMARASKDGQEIDGNAPAAGSQGAPRCARYPTEVADRLAPARWQELLDDPPPHRRRHALPTRGRADVAP
jgi:hypothetical protein